MLAPRALLLAFVLGGAAAAGCFPKDDLDDFSQAPRGGSAGSAGAAGASGGTGGAGAGSGGGGAGGSEAGQGGSPDSGVTDAGLDAGDPLDASTLSDSGAPHAS